MSEVCCCAGIVCSNPSCRATQTSGVWYALDTAHVLCHSCKMTQRDRMWIESCQCGLSRRADVDRVVVLMWTEASCRRGPSRRATVASHTCTCIVEEKKRAQNEPHRIVSGPHSACRKGG